MGKEKSLPPLRDVLADYRKKSSGDILVIFNFGTVVSVTQEKQNIFWDQYHFPTDFPDGAQRLQKRQEFWAALLEKYPMWHGVLVAAVNRIIVTGMLGGKISMRMIACSDDGCLILWKKDGLMSVHGEKNPEMTDSRKRDFLLLCPAFIYTKEGQLVKLK